MDNDKMAGLVERLEHCSKNTRDEYLHELTGRSATALRTITAERDALAKRVGELEVCATSLHGALAAHTCFGCPQCPGDCSSANPPVLSCPTQRAIEAFRLFDATLKGTDA